MRDALRTIALVSLGLICVSGAALGQDTVPNLILNGDLRQGAGNLPENWHTNGWKIGPEFASGTWVHRSGAPGELEVFSLQPNDFYWAQTLHLDPGWYHFTAEVRAEDVPQGGGGANLSVIEDGITSPHIFGTTDWQTVGFYLKVGSSSGDVSIACRLGGFASLNTGKAFCRNIQAVAVNEAPAD